MWSIEATDAFLARAAALGISFEEGDLDRFGGYLSLLLDETTRVNLTSVRDPDEAWMKHIFDSLTLLPLLVELEAGSAVADVGSGGGAPGLPLAIALPGLRFTLIESTGKKAAFLERASSSLGLTNVEVLAERAETVGRSARRETFAAATARAVGPLRVVAELVLPLARVGGRALLIKGGRAEEEVQEAAGALAALRGEVEGIVPTPTGRIVSLVKRRPTPRRFPRRPGEPKHAPL